MTTSAKDSAARRRLMNHVEQKEKELAVALEALRTYNRSTEKADWDGLMADPWEKGPVLETPYQKGSEKDVEMEEFLLWFRKVKTYNPDFAWLLNSMARTHVKKNQDYADWENGDYYSNFEYAEKVAAPFSGIDKVFATIIGIKMARMAELMKGKTPNNESLDDSQLDLTVYCGLWKSYHTHQRKVGVNEIRIGDFGKTERVAEAYGNSATVPRNPDTSNPKYTGHDA